VIASLKGILIGKTKDLAVLEVGGIGYEVSVAPSTMERLPSEGKEVFLHVSESIGMYGGGVTYYGFLTSDEKIIYNVIRNNVAGIGARKALDLLDKAGKSLPDFRRAVQEKDIRTLVSLFGFTKKTAEKIVAGLQDVLGEMPSMGSESVGPMTSAFEESIQGLVALGYRETLAREAAQSARALLGPSSSSENIIREALRHLSGRS